MIERKNTERKKHTTQKLSNEACLVLFMNMFYIFSYFRKMQKIFKNAAKTCTQKNERSEDSIYITAKNSMHNISCEIGDSDLGS